MNACCGRVGLIFLLFMTLASSFSKIRYGNRSKLRIRLNLKRDLEGEVDILTPTKEQTAFFQCEHDSISNSQIVSNVQRMGIETIKATQRPHGKDEAWRFTNIKKLFSKRYSRLSTLTNEVQKDRIDGFIDEEYRDGLLVFIDGEYSPELSTYHDGDFTFRATMISNENCLLSPTALQALQHVPHKGVLPRQSFGSDVLTGLNSACLDDALHIEAKQGLSLIQLIYCNTLSSQESKLKSSFPRTIVEARTGAELKLKQSYISVRVSDEEEQEMDISNFVCGNTRFVLDPNCTVQHTIIQELSLQTRHVDVVSAEVSERSSYDLQVLQIGAMQSRINIHANLSGPLANCSVRGIMMNENDQVHDLHSSILHNAPSTFSDQIERIVLGESGRAVFKGHIMIPKIGQKSEANQQCRTIMLGTKGRVQAMPTLEITADDVACSHGAAIADLDQNALFYVSSRGINPKEAKKMLTKSFVLEVINQSLADAKTAERLMARLLSLNPSESNRAPLQSAQQLMSL